MTQELATIPVVHEDWPFDIEPREVQLEALAKSKGKEGFAFFMRQRLGKTWTCYAEYTKLRDAGKVDWFFLICPNSIKEQWKNAIEEVDEFTPICIYDAGQKARTERYFAKNKSGGVFIINYESVKTFVEAEGTLKFSPLRTYIVADESTKIKDHRAKMTKACLALAHECAYKRVLTGRPMANSNMDMWSQMKFINATNLNAFQHRYHYTMMGGYMGRQMVCNVNTEHLQKCLEPVSYIAADKYLTVFEKIYEPLRRLLLTPAQMSDYKTMEDELMVILRDGTRITAQIALVKYLRLQQISSGIAGVTDDNEDETKQVNTIPPEHNPRIKLVKDILENECNHKTIIACRFRLSVDNLVDQLTKDGYKVAAMVGGMGKEIEEVKERFNSGDIDIMVAQLQVLAYGHRLSGSDLDPCDSIIYYENDFSLLNRIQSESRPEDPDRPERTGHGNPISYYDIYATKMDKYILEALRKKESASLALMGYAREYGIRPVKE